jgi:hypothetical protein
MRSTREVRGTVRRRGAVLLAAAAAVVPMLLLGAPVVPAAADTAGPTATTTPATPPGPTTPVVPTTPSGPAAPAGPADPADPAAPAGPADPADPASPLTIEAPEAVTLPAAVTQSDRVKISVGFGKDRPGHPTGPRTITVDTSGTTAVVDFYQFPDCDRGATEDIHVCTIPHTEPDGSDTVTFTASAQHGVQGGPDHLIKYTGSWGGVQATPAVTRVRVGGATDLQVAAPRPTGVKPSSRGSFQVTVTNKGLVGADAFLFEAQVTSRRIALVKDDPACTYSTVHGRDHMACRYDVPIAPGGTFTAVRPVGFTTQADSYYEEIAISATALVSPGPGKPPVADHSPYYGGVRVLVETTADFRATGARLTGPVGAKVKAHFTFVNAGPAATDSPAMEIYVKVPKGTQTVDVPRVCDSAYNEDGSEPDPKHPARYLCYLDLVNMDPGVVQTLDFTFRIVSADVAPGEVNLVDNSHASPADPDPANNKAPITVTVTGPGSTGSPTPSGATAGGGSPTTPSGGLASTGSAPIALITAASATALTLGTATFLTFRRRSRH